MRNKIFQLPNGQFAIQFNGEVTSERFATQNAALAYLRDDLDLFVQPDESLISDLYLHTFTH